jgi:hypothetical protein
MDGRLLPAPAGGGAADPARGACGRGNRRGGRGRGARRGDAPAGPPRPWRQLAAAWRPQHPAGQPAPGRAPPGPAAAGADPPGHALHQPAGTRRADAALDQGHVSQRAVVCGALAAFRLGTAGDGGDPGRTAAHRFLVAPRAAVGPSQRAPAGPIHCHDEPRGAQRRAGTGDLGGSAPPVRARPGPAAAGQCRARGRQRTSPPAGPRTGLLAPGRGPVPPHPGLGRRASTGPRVPVGRAPGGGRQGPGACTQAAAPTRCRGCGSTATPCARW